MTPCLLRFLPKSGCSPLSAAIVPFDTTAVVTVTVYTHSLRNVVRDLAARFSHVLSWPVPQAAEADVLHVGPTTTA